MKERQVLYEEGTVKETIVVYCTRTEEILQCGQLWQYIPNLGNRKCLRNTTIFFLHSVEQVFIPVPVLLLRRVNTRTRTSQCR